MSVINSGYQNYIHNSVVTLCNQELGFSPTLDEYPLNNIITTIYQQKVKPANLSDDKYHEQMTLLIIRECVNYLQKYRNPIAQAQNFLQPVSTSIHNQSQNPVPQFQTPISTQEYTDPSSLLNQKLNERADLDMKMHTHKMPNLNLSTNTSTKKEVRNISSQLLQYLSMNKEEQEKFAVTSPMLYDEIQKILKQNINDDKGNNTNMNNDSNGNSNSNYSSYLSRYSPNNQNNDNTQNMQTDSAQTIITSEPSHISHPITHVDESLRDSPAKGTISNERGMQELLDLDFRRELTDITDNSFKLSFREYHNVRSIKLESCVLGNNYLINNEPYLYLCIDELPSNYVIGKQRTNVFGKLLLERSINGFNVYKPENSYKVFDKPMYMNELTVSFYGHDLQKLNLQRMNVKKVCKYEKSNKYELVCNTEHYLSVNDNLISINTSNPNRIQVSKLNIAEIIDKNRVVLSQPIVLDKNLQFEKIGIRCVLTFRITFD